MLLFIHPSIFPHIIHLFVHLSLCATIYLSIYLSSIHWSTCPSILPLVYLSIHPSFICHPTSVRPSIHLSIYPSMHPSSIHLSIHLSIHPSNHPSRYSSVRSSIYPYIVHLFVHLSNHLSIIHHPFIGPSVNPSSIGHPSSIHPHTIITLQLSPEYKWQKSPVCKPLTPAVTLWKMVQSHLTWHFKIIVRLAQVLIWVNRWLGRSESMPNQTLQRGVFSRCAAIGSFPQIFNQKSIFNWRMLLTDVDAVKRTQSWDGGALVWRDYTEILAPLRVSGGTWTRHVVLKRRWKSVV